MYTDTALIVNVVTTSERTFRPFSDAINLMHASAFPSPASFRPVPCFVRGSASAFTASAATLPSTTETTFAPSSEKIRSNTVSTNPLAVFAGSAPPPSSESLLFPFRSGFDPCAHRDHH
eukprot:jgi/Pico_ML_1/51134/g2217.t1